MDRDPGIRPIRTALVMGVPEQDLRQLATILANRNIMVYAAPDEAVETLLSQGCNAQPLREAFQLAKYFEGVSDLLETPERSQEYTATIAAGMTGGIFIPDLLVGDGNAPSRYLALCEGLKQPPTTEGVLSLIRPPDNMACLNFFPWTAIVSDESDYAGLRTQLAQHDGTSLAFRRELAIRAASSVSRYFTNLEKALSLLPFDEMARFLEETPDGMPG